MRTKRPGANGNRGETTHGMNRIRGETTRIRSILFTAALVMPEKYEVFLCISSWTMSSFINSALKNEIWKIPLQIFVFFMFMGTLFLSSS
jgi:hypothetical protein